MTLDADPLLQKVAAGLFALALVHTFAAKQIERLAARSPRHAGLFHLLGEIEVVFGFWAIMLIACMAVLASGADAIEYAESRNYTEPLFVFVVMVVAASRPILHVVEVTLHKLAHALPLPAPAMLTWLSLCVVPLFGSLITEPAAMTIAALMLAPLAFQQHVPEHLKYMALGALFVNVSIGGTLTSYAAPPVLMVASSWGWDSAFMLTHFGWKAAIVVSINATMATFALRSHLRPTRTAQSAEHTIIPPTVIVAHIAFLVGVVVFAHHPVIFVGLFLMFLGFTQAYERFQSPLIIREALLVAFFLAGLVLLGGMQRWWLQPIVSGLEPLALFFSALGLTAITDNAALTYLGSLITEISAESKYLLVAGAVAGGGLTVIANAPNPAGVTLLKRGFADETVSAGGLLLGAAVPTVLAAAAFVLL